MCIAVSYHVLCMLCSYSYTTDEIHFNLMAIVADRKKLFEKEISELENKRDTAAQRVREPPPPWSPAL